MNTHVLPLEKLSSPKKPDDWKKEPWLFLFVGGPLIVVCASIVTGIIAWRGADPVVAADYYRQGLMINTDLHRDAKARELGLQAEIIFDAQSNTLQMQLQATKQLSRALPETVQISIASADESLGAVNELVRRLPMSQTTAGNYVGNLGNKNASDESKAKLRMNMSEAKLMHIKVETTEWRLTGDWFDPKQRSIHLVAAK